jgi:hypothetical protein
MASFINVKVENVRVRKVYKEQIVVRDRDAKFYIDFNLKIFCGYRGSFWTIKKKH